MFIHRVVTAVVGIIIAIFVVNYGQWVFAAAALLLTLLAWHEFSAMACCRQVETAYWLGVAGIVLIWGTAWLGNARETMAVVLLIAFIALAKMVFAPERFSFQDAAATIAGVVYVGLAFAHLVLLRFTDYSVLMATKFGPLSAGAVYLWLAFVGTWSSDTFAYLVGSRFGRRKLAPKVSPGKTWEGTIGGVVGSVIGVTAMGAACALPLGHSAAIGLLVGVVAPVGDLVESSIKRFCAVKDSGRLLPGHGGVLDRFDSVMFAAPAVYYYLQIFIVR
ncbi:phosphatidate cytidylyltransferase [Anaeroselena agilis]|uniref:Phosphatidate cytidylyltransferase n=1 Tax=Anaeroselena agilis TaxID=3063788 RepID=A0ABU3NWY3_9FIRM|nr:phosphatidate cytidylyltransferase [Selenomonadales bacterium 4137-cl]